MDVDSRIDAILKEKKMSRRQLAIAAGIPESTLAASFSRRSEKFSPKYLLRIAQVLGVSIIDLDPNMGALKNIEEVAEINRDRIKDQLNYLAYVALIHDEFIKKGLLDGLRDGPEKEGLYELLSLAASLNQDGLNKLIGYALDIIKIYEYRHEGAKHVVNLLMKGTDGGE